MARKSLENWIHEALTDADKDGRISMLSLVHMTGMQESVLHSTKFTGENVYSAKDLAAMFRGKAETYAQDLSGVQTFCLLAFYGGRNEPEGKQPFTVTPQNQSNGLTTEAPTEQGITQQRMRHTETGMSMIFNRQAHLDTFSLGLIREMMTANISLARENREGFSVVKEMMMEMVTKNHERDMEKLKYERETAMFQKAMQYAPGLINQIVGKQVFPQNTEDTALIDSIAEHLANSPNGEQAINMLGAVFPPQIVGVINARLTRAIEEKRLAAERSAIVHKVAERHPDPAADAAGEVVGSIPGYLNGRG